MEIHHFDVLSFSGGILIALIFLVLIPEVVGISDSVWVFPLMLTGFVVFHLTEKYLYQHVKNKRVLMEDLKELHAFGFFLDHFILGFILVTVLGLEDSLKFLIVIPIFLHTISSSISLDHIHEKAKTHVNKVILSISPILGALTAITLKIDENIQGLFLAFAIGMLIYVVNKDILPEEAKGKVTLFAAGAIIVAVIWVLIEF
jgi:zinc transporter ZupT